MDWWNVLSGCLGCIQTIIDNFDIIIYNETQKKNQTKTPVKTCKEHSTKCKTRGWVKIYTKAEHAGCYHTTIYCHCCYMNLKRDEFNKNKLNMKFGRRHGGLCTGI